MTFFGWRTFWYPKLALRISGPHSKSKNESHCRRKCLFLKVVEMMHVTVPFFYFAKISTLNLFMAFVAINCLNNTFIAYARIEARKWFNRHGLIMFSVSAPKRALEKISD